MDGGYTFGGLGGCYTYKDEVFGLYSQKRSIPLYPSSISLSHMSNSQLMTRLSIIAVMATSLLYVAIVAALSIAKEANARRNHRQRLLRNL